MMPMPEQTQTAGAEATPASNVAQAEKATTEGQTQPQNPE